MDPNNQIYDMLRNAREDLDETYITGLKDFAKNNLVTTEMIRMYIDEYLYVRTEMDKRIEAHPFHQK